MVSVDDLDAMFSLGEAPPTSKNVLVALVARNDTGEPVAFAFVKTFAEVVLIPDRTKPKSEIGRALVEVYKKGTELCAQAGVEELHAFAEDPEFADILRDHLKFEDTPGEALSLRLE